MGENEFASGGAEAGAQSSGGPPHDIPASQKEGIGAGDSSPVDLTILEEIAFLKPEQAGAFLKEVISVYLESSGRQMEEIRRAAAAADAGALFRAAHSLKSPSGHLGAMGLMEICREVEGLARGGDLAGAVGRLGALESEYERVRLFLKGRLSSLV